MLTFARIPQFYKDVLAMVQQVAPEAIIGGGALRDLHYGRQVKDIDIFVGPDNWADDAPSVPGCTLNPVVPLGCNLEEYKEFWGGRLIGVYDLFVNSPDVPPFSFTTSTVAHLPVQVIVLKNFPDFPDVLEDFDLFFSQIGFNGDRLHATNGFWDDEYNGTITVRPGADAASLQRTEKRLDRMALKYPEKRIVR